MAAATKARNTPVMGAGGFLASYPVAASTIIYQGTMVALDASGNAVPGSALTTLKTVGMALTTIDNSAGIAAALNVPVQFCTARVGNGSSITKASIGKLCYYLDDQTVTTTSTGSSVAGVLEQVDSLGVWVALGQLSAPAA